MFASTDQDTISTLLEVSALVHSRLGSAHSLPACITESAVRLTKGEAAVLLIHDLRIDHSWIESIMRSGGQESGRRPLSLVDGVSPWLNNSTSVSARLIHGEDHPFSADLAAAAGIIVMYSLAVPFRVSDDLSGTLIAVRSQRGSAFTEEAQRLLETFSVQAGIAMRNAAAFRRTRSTIVQTREKTNSLKENIITASSLMEERILLAERMAQTDSCILILGEKGVGKSLFAECIHAASRRADKPFVRVECFWTPGTSLEADLFGFVDETDTGSPSVSPGLLDTAQGGTLFLDEISALPLKIQTRILKLLQHKIFEPCGSTITRTADIRILASSSRDIEALVKRGEFRADLFYRIMMLPLSIPPLRERTEDIQFLSEHFLEQCSHETMRSFAGFTDQALGLLRSYAWPGNVRELANTIEHAAILAPGPWIDSRDLAVGTMPGIPEDYRGGSLHEAIIAFKRRFLISALESNRWNQTETARKLDIQRTYLSRLIKDLSIANTKE